MFNLKGRDTDGKDAGKASLKPALYDPASPAPKGIAATVPRGSPLTSAAVRDSPTPTPAPAVAASRDEPPPAPGVAAEGTHAAAPTAEAAGSRLAVGINIKLKGVEISDCDVLVIEGHVEATVHSKAMQIARPGTLEGIAEIDVAEIHGAFSGELTARKRLVVHGTGRVAGTIRYGQLVVAEGGELSGDVKRLDSAGKAPHAPREPVHDARHLPGLVYDKR